MPISQIRKVINSQVVTLKVASDAASLDRDPPDSAFETTTSVTTHGDVATMNNTRYRRDVPQTRINVRGNKAVDFDGTPLIEITFSGLLTDDMNDVLELMNTPNTNSGQLPYRWWRLQGVTIDNDSANTLTEDFIAKVTSYDANAGDQGGFVASATLRVRGY